jgi:hypothetical protein
MKKGISENKVKRMRNIVRGNYTDRTRIQSGYTKVSVEYKEGDVWEERGKSWTIKNGIKQNITKLDQARKKIKVPLSCPKCGGEMNHNLSKYYWTKLGMCKNCAVKFHTRLKIDGKWDEYVKRIQDDNFEFYINELKKEYEDWLQSVDSKYITEAGIVEDWSGGKTKKELSKGFEEELKKLEIKHGNPKGTDRETN